jgi:hypothetical protein
MSDSVYNIDNYMARSSEWKSARRVRLRKEITRCSKIDYIELSEPVNIVLFVRHGYPVCHPGAV